MTDRRFTASISFMFREFPVADRFAAARDAGFAGVEIQVLDEAEPEILARAASKAGLPVHLVNVGMGDFLAGGLGLSGVPGRTGPFRVAAERAFAAAERLGARYVHLGPSRVPSGEPACLDVWRANAAHCLEAAAGRGFDLLLEPMNPVDAPTALFNDVDHAADLLRREFSGRIGLLFDLYHLAMAGTDLSAAANRYSDLIRHVQFSDAPGRHEPGTGKTDFRTAFAALETSGYAGPFGAEYFPSRPTLETLQWLGPLRQR